MNTITINRNDLVAELANALQHAGGTDWDLYVDAGGNVDTRHITHPNHEWFEIIDLYNCSLENDGLYPGDQGYDYQAAAEWIVDEYGISDSIEVDDYESHSVKIVNIEIA